MLGRLAAILPALRPSCDPLCAFRLHEEYGFWIILNDIKIWVELHYKVCHISYCETFRIYLLITGNQFGIVAALWWRSHVAKPGSRQTQNVDDDIDEFAPLEAFIVLHLRERFYVKFGVTTI